MIRCIEMAPGDFEVSGRVDVTTLADFRSALQEAVDSAAPLGAVPGAVIRIDVCGLELVDAAGLGVLVAMHRRAGRAGLRFALRNVPEPLSRLLFISRLYRVLSVEQPQIGLRRELAPHPRTPSRHSNRDSSLNSVVDAPGAIVA
jgi:anti-anti-sigma factor